MSIYGLIGKKLSHSFSKDYFTSKFEKLGVNSSYELFELENINEFEYFKNKNDLKGLNVTIPYKQSIIPFLDKLDPIAKEIGAVNTIRFESGQMIGYNSDYYGFKESIQNFISDFNNISALVLGTGGASKAVQKVLKDLQIDFKLVSRIGNGIILTYEDITSEIVERNKLIINTTPLGMFPFVNEFPSINYNFLSKEHYCFDLVYNPENTLFLLKCKEKGAKIINGLQMLRIQAEKSWKIWNT